MVQDYACDVDEVLKCLQVHTSTTEVLCSSNAQ